MEAPDPQRRPARQPDQNRAGSAPRNAAELRVSDEDRHRVAEVLRQAAGEGRLDLDELDERLEAAYQAKTYGDLVPITADLPIAHSDPPLPTPRRRAPVANPTGPSYASSVAIMSENKRLGEWVVEGDHTAVAVMGSVLLDLREAAFTAEEVVITATAVMGEVKVIVDAGTRVVVDGVGIMGEFCEQRARVAFDPDEGGPVVRVRGFALMGSVNVQRRRPPGEARGVRRELGWH
jgi:hypothetical protein